MKLLLSNLLWFLLVITSFSTIADQCASDSDTAASYQLKWSSSSLGTGLGLSGLHSFDSNADGMQEVIFGSGAGFGVNTSFFVAEYSVEAEGFVIICESSRYEEGINKVTPFLNETINAGSLIALGGGIIEVIDHKLGFKAQRIQTSIDTITDLISGDIDNDGEVEIIALSNSEIAIYDGNSYAFEQSLNYGGNEFAIGHFSKPDTFQLAINTGYVLELSGDSFTIIWDYSVSGFSDEHLEAGDIDNDGLDEVVAADSWYNMRVFNADIQGFLWEHSSELDISAMDVYDVTGDGIPEVLYGDGQHGSVYALNNVDGDVLWSVSNPAHGTTDVFIGNIDNDLGLELVWGSGHSSTGADYLSVHDIETDTRQWQSSVSSEGIYSAVAFGRLNADQVPDIIYASSSSQSGDGILTAIDGATDEVLWKTTSSTFGRYAWTGIHDIAIGDINGDDINEVVVGTDRLYDGYVYILDASNGEVTGNVELEDGSPIYSVLIADIDGDEDIEIIAGGGKEHTGAEGVFVYVIDGETLQFSYKFPNLGNTWTDLWNLAIVDIDEDDTQEIIALLDKAYIIDPDNNGLTSTMDDYHSIATSIDIFSGDSVVYLANTQGELLILASDGTTSTVGSVCNESVTALEAITPVKLAFICAGALGTYDTVGKVVSWITDENFDSYLGTNDRLAVETVNGKSQILIGGQKAYLFEEVGDVSSDKPTATDGNFSGHFNQSLTGTLLASNPGNAELSYGIYQQASSGIVEINSQTGEFIYTPTGSYSGDLEFQFYVSNGSAASNIATVTIELTNTVPEAENSSHHFHWQGVNLFNLNGVDADEDVLQFEIVQSPSVGVLTLLNSATGNVSYVNNSSLATETYFLYRVSDGANYSETRQVNIEFTNALPIAPVISFETFVNIPLSTLINGEDDDGDTLTYQLLGDVTTGQVTLTGDGLFTYQAEEKSSHTSIVSYRVFDGRSWSNIGEITLLVHGGDVSSYSPIYLSNFSADKYAGVSELTVDFVSSLAGGSGNYTYLWDFGDGTTSTVKDPQHTYTEIGEYEVTLIAIDGEDDTNQARGYLQIKVLEVDEDFSPIVLESFKASDYAGIAAHNVDFTLSASGGLGSYDYLWDFGDGSTSTQQNPNHNFLIAGEYTVNLIVTDPDNVNNKATGELKILVLSEPKELNINLVSSSSGLDSSFTVDIEGNEFSYSLEIDYGDGNTDIVTITENSYTFNHSYDLPGAYRVEVIAKSQTNIGVQQLSMSTGFLTISQDDSETNTQSSPEGGSFSIISLFILFVLSFFRRKFGVKKQLN